MSSSLSNLVNNLPEVIFKIKYIYGHFDNKKGNFVELNTKNLSASLNTQALQMI